MKCLITENGDGIIMDNIVSVEWLFTKDLPKKLKEYAKKEAVVIAKDINKHKLLLGEYSTWSYAELAVEDIMKWLSDPTISDLYYIYSANDGIVTDTDAPIYNYPSYYETYLKKNTVECSDENSSPNEENISLLSTVNLGLSWRVCNVLSNNGIKSLADIITLSPEKLKKLKGLGESDYNEVINALSKRGRKLCGHN